MTAERKHKILVVDDDPLNLKVILDILKKTFSEVIYARDGKRACELAIQEKPDVIIMDWEMPVMNGIEAIDQLTSDPETKDIPIIIATGVMIQSDNMETALSTGAVDFLRKPFDPIEFRARLKNTLFLSDSFRQIRQQKLEIQQLADKEKELLQESLDQKERQLSTAAMYEYQKSMLLSDLLIEIKRLDTVTNNLHAPEIRKITRQIKSYLDLDKSWTNFKMHFEEVHPGFFERIGNEFNDLTTNEKRICAYLRIGLGNKEIALLTNVESASVRRALNRLKKKLALSPADSLRDFVAGL